MLLSRRPLVEIPESLTVSNSMILGLLIPPSCLRVMCPLVVRVADEGASQGEHAEHCHVLQASAAHQLMFAEQSLGQRM